TSDRFDGKFSEFLHGVDQAVGVDVIVVRSHLYVTGWQNQVRFVDCADYVHRTELAGGQLVRVDVDHDLPVFATEGRRNLGGLHDCDLVADRELTDVMQLRLIESFAFQSDEANGQAGGVKLQNDRGQGSGRQSLQVG